MPQIGIVGLLLIALFTLWRVVLAVAAPRHEATRRDRLDQIRAWQRQQLSLLRAKPFPELQALPIRSDLEPPPQFQGERFAIIRAAGSNGGVEVGVAHFHQILGIIISSITPSFEMLPNGTILEPNTDPDD